MIEYMALVRALKNDRTYLSSKAAKAIEELIELHQLDNAEIMKLRRQIGAMADE